MEEADWAINEFGAVELGDTRRTDRLAQRPAASLPAACDDLAMLKGAYRLLENPAVPLVRAVQDTAELDYTRHPGTTGLGPIGNGYGRGLLVHTTLAITPDRLPLGLLAQQDWARGLAWR